MDLRYPDEELVRFLDDIESDLVERKSAWKGDVPEKSRQAVCAFANDLSNHGRPGILFVGVDDKGQPSGLTIDDELLRTLADLKTDGKIVPPPTLVVEKRRLRGGDVAVVTVQPADAPPVRYDGRIWIRLGPRRGIASAQDERILNERRKHRDLPFDIQPVVSADLKSISRVIFEQEYLPNAFARDVIEANDRTYEERLAACRMVAAVDNPTPTILGILVLGKSPLDWLPGAYIQFLRLAGSEWSDAVIDEAVIDGPIGQVIRRADEKLDAHNVVKVDISKAVESRVQAYPAVALQQLVRNAVMHRSYENTNAPVRVYWFDDRIEIHSPGGPFGAVTTENFGRAGITDYRNPHIADAMKVLGLVQRFGIGISTARSALARNGNPPPEFNVTRDHIVATVRKRD